MAVVNGILVLVVLLSGLILGKKEIYEEKGRF
jgi:hypothetical protein